MLVGAQWHPFDMYACFIFNNIRKSFSANIHVRVSMTLFNISTAVAVALCQCIYVWMFGCMNVLRPGVQ